MQTECTIWTAEKLWEVKTMNKLFVSVISLMTALPIGAGLICRQSFTDISQDDKPFDNFEIGLLSENTALNIKE